MVRAEMSTTAKILGTITYGEVIAVERIETPAGGLPWARLAEPERCGLQGNLSSVSIFPPDEAFVLIDGTALGLGPLLQEVVDTAHQPPATVWDFPRRLYIACINAKDERTCRVGLPERVRYSRLLDSTAEAERQLKFALEERLRAESHYQMLSLIHI